MIRKINNQLYIVIPPNSFISLFSKMFINRHKQLSRVVKTSLFSEEFSVNLELFVKTLKQITNSDSKFNLFFIAENTSIFGGDQLGSNLTLFKPLYFENLLIYF